MQGYDNPLAYRRNAVAITKDKLSGKTQSSVKGKSKKKKTKTVPTMSKIRLMSVTPEESSDTRVKKIFSKNSANDKDECRKRRGSESALTQAQVNGRS